MAVTPIANADTSSFLQSDGSLQEALVSSGGGAGGTVEVSNFPASQAVTGPLTNAQFIAVTGAASAAAWDGVAASATAIAILKAIHAQNALMITALNTIAANTEPAP